MASVKNMLVGLLMIAGSVWLVCNHMPNLLSDMRTGDWVPATDLKVEKAKCTVYTFVVSTCSIDYSSRQSPAAKPNSLAYFVYGSWGSEHFGLWRSASQPELVSTSLAIRDLNARLLTMAVWIALMLVGCFALVRMLFAGDGAAASDQRPETVDAPSVRTASCAPAAARAEFGRRNGRV